MKIPSFGEENLILERIWSAFPQSVFQGTLEPELNATGENLCFKQSGRPWRTNYPSKHPPLKVHILVPIRGLYGSGEN